MKYFKKIKLSCASLITEFAINDTLVKLQNRNWDSQLQIRHVLPEDLQNTINDELSIIKIPNMLYCQTYLRKQNNIQSIHVDGTKDGLIHAAINIPLIGVSSNRYNWYSGNYELKHVYKSNLSYHDIVWRSPPVLADTIELNETYLIRVDAPHSAVAGPSERWIFTMRFCGNPSFEELYNSIINNE